MRYRRSVPEIIYEWANDIVGRENAVLPIIEELLENFKEITSLWRKEDACNDTEYKIIDCLARCNAFGSIDIFSQKVNSSAYQIIINSQLKNGTSYEEAHKQVLKYFASTSGLDISDSRAFEAFYKSWNELQRLQNILYQIKKQYILENADFVFQKCRLIALIRRQNVVFSSVIGSSTIVESILGPNGEKIKEEDENAIRYIISLEDEEDELDTRKSIIESKQLGRK